jgi:ribosome maturation factor RimP
LDDLGVELVEIAVVGAKSHPIIRAYIYKPGGVTIDDCTAVSRPFSLELDAADLFESSYTLEVSSPGLDRPLVTPDDFRRRHGFQVRVCLKNKKEPIVGTIHSTDGDLVLQTPEGEMKIGFDSVEEGLLEF